MTARSHAMVLGDRSLREVWSFAPVQVTVTLAGYTPIAFARRMDDRAPESITLEPRDG